MRGGVIVVLGGGLILENGRWRTTSFPEPGDRHGILGDRLRVEAGCARWKRRPEFLVLASGGTGQLADTEGAPAVALVLKREMVELGVPEDRILTETASANTRGQLIETARMARELGIGRLEIVSNRYHLPRIRALLECDPELAAAYRALRVDVVSAEEELLESDRRRWDGPIREAYASEAMRRRIEREAEGIARIRGETAPGGRSAPAPLAGYAVVPAERGDSRRIWEIRNSRDVRLASGDEDRIDLASHEAWFAGRYFGREDNRCFVLRDLRGGEAVGYCRFDRAGGGEALRVSIALDPEARGSGLGAHLLAAATAMLGGGRTLLAEIRKDNAASLKIFRKNGYVIRSEDGAIYRMQGTS